MSVDYNSVMKIGYFILRDELRADARMQSLLKDLEQASAEVYEIQNKYNQKNEMFLNPKTKCVS